tara:strand:- start:174 stop:815 length:642 start_codon:yes stop_codon:yes gene_type:complete
MKDIFFIDFETTGLNVFHHDIIEVGIKKIGDNSFYNTLVTPKENNVIHATYQYIPDRIRRITGITDNMILESGIHKDQMIENMFNHIRSNSNDDIIYLVAHNGYGFDFVFLKRYVNEYNNTVDDDQKISLDNIRFIDSMYLAKLYLVNDRVSLPSLCQKYNIQNTAEHRAMGDVLALESLYIELCHQYSSKKEYNYNHYLDYPEDILKETLYY